RPDGEPFVMAGLWERWALAGDEPLETCTIITTGANDTLAPIHHRMPVIVANVDRDAWLDPAPPSAEALTNLLRPAPDDDLAPLAVDRHVNNARHDDPACIEPAPSGLLL
ncbi:MAG: SOS response-associated peptidase family protein, partial [Pseudomonadota bacterium]|nr:SOS response-associated peptidase family protein [Pseudomonadota bacterium]